jgi:hypothetical protein
VQRKGTATAEAPDFRSSGARGEVQVITAENRAHGCDMRLLRGLRRREESDRYAVVPYEKASSGGRGVGRSALKLSPARPRSPRCRPTAGRSAAPAAERDGQGYQEARGHTPPQCQQRKPLCWGQLQRLVGRHRAYRRG